LNGSSFEGLEQAPRIESPAAAACEAAATSQDWSKAAACDLQDPAAAPPRPLVDDDDSGEAPGNKLQHRNVAKPLLVSPLASPGEEDGGKPSSSPKPSSPSPSSALPSPCRARPTVRHRDFAEVMAERRKRGPGGGGGGGGGA